MYRNPLWKKGFYIDNHMKYVCHYCEKEFIVGKKLLQECSQDDPICPYCGHTGTECTVWTDDDQLAELADEMGCLAIYIDEELNE